ncbi:MAG: histidine--tRNA ligase [Chloroflexota bacterium]
MTVIRSIRGTRDFYPPEMARRSWLYENIRKVSESFGYQEYEGPFLEYVELYAAKSGDELVKEQSYVFEDRSGELIALRPELTPTLVRMIGQRQRQLNFPLRWWSFGPFWRYERPQKGRTREFFQWNIDLVGVDTPESDAELVAVAATFFRQVGLKPQEIILKVNNRRLMESELGKLGLAAGQRDQAFRLIDRRDKTSPEKWRADAKGLGLSEGQVRKLEGLLGDQNLWESSEELVRFFKAVEALNVQEYVQYAPEVIRGLDYYTGTVFEAHDSSGEFRAILGGGRYDDLMAAVGGEALPGVGFAMGDVVISLVLERYGCLPNVDELTASDILVTVFDEASWLESYKLAAELRGSGFRVVCYPQPVKLPKQFKYADRISARVALVLGPEELREGKVTVKNLLTREQQTIPRAALVEVIRGCLE